ncbi:hypothetical protein ACP4OV_024515 [Aristida adscensionis]
MEALQLPSTKPVPAQNGNAFPATKPIKQEEDGIDDIVDSILSLPVEFEANSRDTTLIMEQEEEEEEEEEAWSSSLDELLRKAQLFSQFLLEKMGYITDEGVEHLAKEQRVEDKKRGYDQKRKTNEVAQYNNKKAKAAVAAMRTRSQENCLANNCDLSEEKRWDKEQANLVPLMTGRKLKSYQIKGLKWLISLWQNGLNGILAGQADLGKTIQTIGFLGHLKGKGVHGPYLIITTLSTLSKWVNEISRSIPSLVSIIYHGDEVARAEIRRKFMPKAVGPDFPIVVTSYDVAMCDARFLAQ